MWTSDEHQEQEQYKEAQLKCKHLIKDCNVAHPGLRDSLGLSVQVSF